MEFLLPCCGTVVSRLTFLARVHFLVILVEACSTFLRSTRSWGEGRVNLWIENVGND